LSLKYSGSPQGLKKAFMKQNFGLSVRVVTAACCMAMFASQAGARQQQQAPQQEGIQGVDKMSPARKLVSAEQVEQAGAQQYEKMKRDFAAKRALGSDADPQVVRLRAIAQRIIPQAPRWNERAKAWQWEVNVFRDPQINAFCMPGGKIAFYAGILEKLQLTDDEAAMIMGHEMAHALREHGRERIGKQMATQGLLAVGGAFFGLGDLTSMLADIGGQLLSLQFGRDDESEADLIGLDLAARSGFDPRAGVTLWQKMAKAGGGSPLRWLSSHPPGKDRVADITRRLPEVMPLYARTQNKTVAQLGPYKTNVADIMPVK
jgi:Zn-dependent protease with chaperone function